MWHQYIIIHTHTHARERTHTISHESNTLRVGYQQQKNRTVHTLNERTQIRLTIEFFRNAQ